MSGVIHGAEAVGECRAERGASGGPSLSPEGTIPSSNCCFGLLRSEIIDEGGPLSGGRSFEVEICSAIARFGADRCGLWTSTPGETDLLGQFQKVLDWREASRRWDSLNSNVVRRRPWTQWGGVMQRHKDGGVHYHFFVVHKENIRGEIDFDAVKRGNYRSAPPALRKEWEFWRRTAPRYGFGRVEFLPVRYVEGVGRYLARYLRREIGRRRECDSHAQLFRFSRSWQRVVLGDACWCDRRALRARQNAAELGAKLWGSEERMIADLGEHWRWKLRRVLWLPLGDLSSVVTRARDYLECYDGKLMALEDALKFETSRREAS
jgi:hypothetical protein